MIASLWLFGNILLLAARALIYYAQIGRRRGLHLTMDPATMLVSRVSFHSHRGHRFTRTSERTKKPETITHLAGMPGAGGTQVLFCLVTESNLSHAHSFFLLPTHEPASLPMVLCVSVPDTGRMRFLVWSLTPAHTTACVCVCV